MLVSEIPKRYLGRGHERVLKHEFSSITDGFMRKTGAAKERARIIVMIASVQHHLSFWPIWHYLSGAAA